MHRVIINVAKNGKHVFRVELGRDGASDGSAANVRKVFMMLTERFIDCQVSATRYQIGGERFNPLLES